MGPALAVAIPIALALLALALELVVPDEGGNSIERLFGFHAGVGFLAIVACIILGRLFGFLLGRPGGGDG
jgi:hypothetical protein